MPTAQKVKRIIENSDARVYRPQGAASDLMYAKDSEVLIEGPAGTGKTRAVLEKVNILMLKYPGSRALLVRKTRTSMTESVLVTYENKVLPRNKDLYPDTEGVTRRVRQSYDYPNGSTVVIGGMDNPDRIMSTEYDVIAAFEATELTEEDWEQLLTRLRNHVIPYQQAIADCNPGGPTHWLNRRANRNLMNRLLSRHTDNPTLYNRKSQEWTVEGKAYIEKLKRLSGGRYLRLMEGKWAVSEGAVYPEFEAHIHIIPPRNIPKEWRRIRTIDFGYTNPFVCQWWAQDPDGRIYRYREIYWSKRLVEDHATQINELSKGEAIEATVCDHDAEDRATLERYGIKTMPAYKEVEVGIQAVKARLAPDPGDPDQRPSLFLIEGALVERDEKLETDKKPQCTEEEIDNYVFSKHVDGKEEKEVPIKVNDHGCDDMRYAVCYFDGYGGYMVNSSGGVVATGG